MNFNRFPKIQNLVKTHQAGYVPAGEYEVTVKMDGANAGIIKQGNALHIHSRNTYLGTLHNEVEDISAWNKLEGFADYMVKRFDWFINNMSDNEHIYAEWLVPHTIAYPNEMYRKLYIFDKEHNKVYNQELGIYPVAQLANFTINELHDSHDLFPQIMEIVQPYVNTTSKFHKTEGVVLKHMESGERFKVVFDEFKEDNRIKFNVKSFDASRNLEVELAGKYPMRSYDKVLEKVKTLKSTSTLEKKHIPAVLGVAWNDYTTEFLGDIIQSYHFPTINTKILKTEFDNRIRTILLSELDSGMRPVWAADK